MRLTAIWYHVKNKRPHGHLYRGKHRIVKDPTLKDLQTLYAEFQLEEKNMLILRHPYLTVAESSLYNKEVNPLPNWPEISREERNQKFQKHFKWNDQLSHLRVTDCWE